MLWQAMAWLTITGYDMAWLAWIACYAMAWLAWHPHCWLRIQRFRISEIQDFRDSGFQRFRISEIQDFRDSGFQGIGAVPSLLRRCASVVLPLCFRCASLAAGSLAVLSRCASLAAGGVAGGYRKPPAAPSRGLSFAAGSLAVSSRCASVVCVANTNTAFGRVCIKNWCLAAPLEPPRFFIGYRVPLAARRDTEKQLTFSKAKM